MPSNVDQLSDEKNWDVVDQAYGSNADLYRSVLRISPSSSSSEITKAYFDRRNELFTILADLDATSSLDPEVLESQKRRAECRMNAVVFAGRVLGDVVLRKEYHIDHSHRIGGRTRSDSRPVAPPALPPHPRKVRRKERQGRSSRSIRTDLSIPSGRPSRRGRNFSPDPDNSDDEEYVSSRRENRSYRSSRSTHRAATREIKSERAGRSISIREEGFTRSGSDYEEFTSGRQRSIQVPLNDDEPAERKLTRSKNSRRTTSTKEPKSRGRPPAVVSPEKDDTTLTMTDVDEDLTYATESIDMGEGGMGATMVSSILKEVSGCLDDTSNSLADVWNVFTLQEDDINNVTDKIRTAKHSLRQMPQNN